MTITRKDALTIALNALTADSYSLARQNVRLSDGHIGDATETVDGAEVREVLSKMIAQLSKPHSPASVEKAKAVRKEKTAQARAELLAKVVPVLREELSHASRGVTVKELFNLSKKNLPEDFTVPRVQYILLNEMLEELVITEVKGKANVYTLKEKA